MNVLETVNQAEINMSSKTTEVQQGIPRNVGTHPYMSHYVETVSCGEFFSRENTPEELKGTHKSSVSERNVDHYDLEWPMLSYYVIYCEKVRNVLQWTEKVALNLVEIESTIDQF